MIKNMTAQPFPLWAAYWPAEGEIRVELVIGWTETETGLSPVVPGLTYRIEALPADANWAVYGDQAAAEADAFGRES